MKNARFILVDRFNVITTMISGAGNVSAEGLTAYTVDFNLSYFATGKYLYDPETGEYTLNPDYEYQTSIGKIYRANIGWVDSDYVPED